MQYLSSDTMRFGKKGISLPVEMIVIIAIAVLVLVVIAAFFAGGFGGGTSTITDQAALAKGCGIWKMRGCGDGSFPIPNYRLAGDTTVRTMSDACSRTGLGSSVTVNSDCWNYCCGTGTVPTRQPTGGTTPSRPERT